MRFVFNNMFFDGDFPCDKFIKIFSNYVISINVRSL